ncbi:MAG: DUF61 family protein [Chloroflexi bacterium]|jgi:uncharacterized protein|nr:DUF61 family protein [Chloroflexota bacterium]MBT7080939.1 DUF61 family protein [Chloroflexota bacterium]MBT7289874.1 DUF61 family protein [Chloroflexota bacterium]
MTGENSSDRLLEKYFSTEFRVLNAHLPREKKSLANLIEEEHPCVLLSDGSAHFFKRKELDLLAGMLTPQEQEKLSLPILIEINPGQNEIGLLASGQSIEAKVLAQVIGMPVVDDKGKVNLYKSQLGEIRANLRTTTQYIFSARM